MARNDMDKKNKNTVELLSEKMGVVFSSAEEIPNEEPEEVIEYDTIGIE